MKQTEEEIRKIIPFTIALKTKTKTKRHKLKN
jgi:hypothetical protein